MQLSRASIRIQSDHHAPVASPHHDLIRRGAFDDKVVPRRRGLAATVQMATAVSPTRSSNSPHVSTSKHIYSLVPTMSRPSRKRTSCYESSEHSSTSTTTDPNVGAHQPHQPNFALSAVGASVCAKRTRSQIPLAPQRPTNREIGSSRTVENRIFNDLGSAPEWTAFEPLRAGRGVGCRCPLPSW